MRDFMSTELSRTRLLRHHSSAGQWELVIRRPDPRLRAYVSQYEGYLETATTRPIRRREVPWPGAVVIINFGPAFRISDPRIAAGPADYRSFLAGVYDSYVVTESTGLSYCLQVNFTPIGAHLFFRLPMDAIANRVVHLEDVLGTEARHLSEQLPECPTWEQRFALLDTLVATRVARARAPSPEIVWAWHRLQLPEGNHRIGALAKELGWSSRRLIAGFREQIGLPPKALARIIRFHRVVRWLDGQDEVRWADLAHRAGYYDQAHFNRDFRMLAGSAPGEFFRRHLEDGGNLEECERGVKFVQDEADRLW